MRRIMSVLAAGLLAGLSAVALGNGAAQAQSLGVAVTPYDPDLLVLGAGEYNVLHDRDNAAVFRGEFRFGNEAFYYIRPLLGVEANTDGGVYGYGGFGFNLPLADAGVTTPFLDHLVLFPSAAVGYWERGDGKNLGSHTEFRTGAELDYRFENASRLGVSFHHLSNAGISDHNPGVEELMLEYALPFGHL